MLIVNFYPNRLSGATCSRISIISFLKAKNLSFIESAESSKAESKAPKGANFRASFTKFNLDAFRALVSTEEGLKLEHFASSESKTKL